MQRGRSVRVRRGRDHSATVDHSATADHSATVDHSVNTGAADDGWPVDQDDGLLWTAVERARTTFVAAGRPARDTIELTISRGGDTRYRVPSPA